MSLITGEKINCLMFIPSMGNGGAERVMATLANALTKKGYDITLVTITSSESFYKLDENIKIIKVGNSVKSKNKIYKIGLLIKTTLETYWKFNRVIREKQPDIVLSFLTHTNIISLLSKPFHSKTHFIVSERAEPNVRNIFYKIITKFLYPTANAIVCQSNKVAKFFPIYALNKIKVISNPINEDSITKLIPTQRRKVIVGVGRLFPQKNFELLIDSFDMVKEEFPEHILEIYGEGYLRNKLQDKISELNIQDKVFLKGVKKDVMKHISDAELFVMSSNFEGFPNALVEAMASGLPVISTDFSTGVARDLVKSENGRVVPINDKQAMANCIKEVLRNKDLQKSMSSNNRKILDELSTEKITTSWIKLFNNLKIMKK